MFERGLTISSPLLMREPLSTKHIPVTLTTRARKSWYGRELDSYTTALPT